MLDTNRHASFFNPAFHDLPVTVIGAGATGSRVVLELAGLGCDNINVYDFDIVENHNLPNQAYFDRHVGMPKVEALEQLVFEKLGFRKPGHKFFNQKVEPGTRFEAAPVVFLLTDSFGSRKEIFRSHILPSEKVLWLIETRMAASHGHVYTLYAKNHITRQRWLASMRDDADVENIEASACGTSMSVGPTAAIIANLAVWQYIHIATEDHDSRDEKLNIYLKPFTAKTERWT